MDHDETINSWPTIQCRLMFESKALDGNDFRVLPIQEGAAMSREVFVSRFGNAIEVCTSMRGLAVSGTCTGREHIFGLEQIPYNGNQLYADEVVLSPNKGICVWDAFSKDKVLEYLWRFDRFPRYVHLGIENYDEKEIHFLVQISCCYCSVYDPKHPNPLYPVRVFGGITSVFSGNRGHP